MAYIPKIRFKGFTEPWEQRKLGDVLKERTERAKGDEELLSVTIANGVIRQIDSEKRNTASEDRSNYKIVKKGDVPYNSMRMWQGAVGNSKYNGIVSPAYTILTPTSEANGKFFMELFKKKSTLQIFQRWSQGLTSDTWNLKYPILSSIQFAIPSVEEQEKIAEYFTSLDHLITLHQRKCDDTKELKKYMLQKMFPKNGEKFPEIRFKGFTEAWEQRKLDTVAKFSKGIGYSKGDLIESGTPIILYGRLYTKYETSISDVDTYVEAKEGAVYSKGGEVIIPASGETAEDIARAATVDKSGILLGGDLNVVMPNKDINSAFLAISISNGNSQRELSKKAQGKSVVHIHNEEIRKLIVPFPTNVEQNKIVDYFSNLDHLITLHQRKCDTLKELKKYMLQNMFPKKG